MGKLTIYTDGGITGDNKEDQPCYYAYVATMEAYGEVASCSAVGFGTSNQAEYKGLLLALSYLPMMLQDVKSNCEDTIVEIRSDSKIMVNQVNGTYKTKDPKLKILRAEVISKLEPLASQAIILPMIHVKRELNSLTDLLCNLAKKNIIKKLPFQPLKEFKEDNNLEKYKALKGI